MAKAIVLIRILGGWVFLQKVFRNFCFPIRLASGVLPNSESPGRTRWISANFFFLVLRGWRLRSRPLLGFENLQRQFRVRLSLA